MQIALWLAIILAFLFLILLPVLLLIFNKNQKIFKILSILFAIFYFILLLIGITCTFNINPGYIEFYFDFSGISFGINKFTLYDFGIFNVLINLSMFLPLGAIIVSFKKSKFYLWQTVLISFTISFGIEFLQWILPVFRSVEFTDLIYNTISGVIGYLIFFAIYYISHKKEANKNKKEIS